MGIPHRAPVPMRRTDPSGSSRPQGLQSKNPDSRTRVGVFCERLKADWAPKYGKLRRETFSCRRVALYGLRGTSA